MAGSQQETLTFTLTETPPELGRRDALQKLTIQSFSFADGPTISEVKFDIGNENYFEEEDYLGLTAGDQITISDIEWDRKEKTPEDILNDGNIRELREEFAGYEELSDQEKLVNLKIQVKGLIEEIKNDNSEDFSEEGSAVVERLIEAEVYEDRGESRRLRAKEYFIAKVESYEFSNEQINEEKLVKNGEDKPRNEENKEPKENSFEDLVQRIRDVKDEDELHEIDTGLLEIEGEISDDEKKLVKRKLLEIYEVKECLFLDGNSDEDLEEFLAAKRSHKGNENITLKGSGLIDYEWLTGEKLKDLNLSSLVGAKRETIDRISQEIREIPTKNENDLVIYTEEYFDDLRTDVPEEVINKLRELAWQNSSLSPERKEKRGLRTLGGPEKFVKVGRGKYNYTNHEKTVEQLRTGEQISKEIKSLENKLKNSVFKTNDVLPVGIGIEDLKKLRQEQCDRYLGTMVELGKIVKSARQKIDSGITSETDEAIRERIKALKDFEDYQEIRDYEDDNYPRKAREILQKAIDKDPVTGFNFPGRGGRVDLNGIRSVLNPLRALMAKRLDDEVAAKKRELELLRMEAKFVDREGNDWGFELSEPEKTKIDSAESEEKLKEIQAEISAIHGQKKVRYTTNTARGPLSSKDVELVKCSPTEMDKVHQLYKDIEEAENLDYLRGLELEVYDEVLVKSTLKKEAMKKRRDAKELKLFKVNFEEGSPSSIVTDWELNQEQKNDRYKKWLAKTGGDEPDDIHSYIFSAAAGIFYAKFTDIINPYNPSDPILSIIDYIDPSRVRKGELNLVRGLLEDIKSKTQARQLFNYPRYNEIEAIDEIWVDNFAKEVNHANSLATRRNLPTVATEDTGENKPDTEKILKYRKNDISPDKASQVFVNHWEDTHFSWTGDKANVPSYTSFGETDYNFCGVKVCQKQLDKVNSIIKDIKEAKTLTDLISEDDATKYEEERVPDNITEIENELNKKPIVLVQELTNSDYQAKLLSLADQDTERKNYKSIVITEITEKRAKKLSQVRQIIANAQTIFAKIGATKQELEKAINDLKNLAKAHSDKKKLSEIDDDKENVPALPTPDKPLTPRQKEFYDKKLDYSIAKKKVLTEIENHQKTCSRKDNSNQIEGGIGEVELAQKQALADLNFHVKECQKPKRLDRSKIFLERDDQGLIWQENVNLNTEPYKFMAKENIPQIEEVRELEPEA
nr:6556_t:CDS:10 [Entrophospora candida]